MTKGGKIIKLLIDTGSNKNYIKSCYTKYPVPNEKIFLASSVGGKIEITHHIQVNLFGPNTPNMKFFILNNLASFDGIIGNDSLMEMGAVIHTSKNYMMIHPSIKIPLKQQESNCVNNINIRTTHMSAPQKEKLLEIINKCPTLFSDPNEKLTYTTRVVGEIRTSNSDPVYSKSYPYPMCLKQEVEKEVKKLLEDGIIRPSRSPYNSPVWVVPKKEDASGEKKYRMVIDYRKLNSITISDTYPIPEINEVLANLGRSQLFSIIDLKSGFHQIPLKESDVEKTAFSVNNGKYEFTRLPFGLKNAPSIFQRALDDILRDHIGNQCYVYIDDIIIFGKDEQTHFENLKSIFKTLEEANMKIQLDKSEFLKTEVEFLGFIVSQNGIKPNPKKVQAIKEIPVPKTLQDLRSFLGLSGYYRRFIEDYAKLVKPLTLLLRGEDGRIPKSMSKNKKINLDDEAIGAFNKTKNALLSREVILSHPNFEHDFELTTDASDYAIGAVLSQGNKPITFISRTLTKTEEDYGTNEKEMLAIIWALSSLRNFLYGSRKVKIFTDHQPLTYSLSNKNTNSKMKRWKARLEEYNYELKYKPGRTNLVADTLSRPPQITFINSTTSTQHSDESSSHDLIPTVEVPINVFRNQIILKIDEETSYQLLNPFPNYHRHIFTQPQYTEADIINIFKRYLRPTITNGLKTTEPIMGLVQVVYPIHFRNYKVRFTQNMVIDIVNETEQNEAILNTHKRAHRNAQENKIQILEKHYFPRMSRKINNILKNCTICKENKYDRHPNNQIINPTPIPNYPGHILHIDIFLTNKTLVLTAIDKFTKLAQAKIIKSRSVEDIRRPLRDLLFFFSVPEVVVIDNEKSLNSITIIAMMEDELNIRVFKTPPYKSEVNGQIERFHSTLTELMRCINSENNDIPFEELLERSVKEYNYSVHSTTGKKPVELFYGRSINANPENFEENRQKNIERLKRKQEKDIKFHNKRRKPIKTYRAGDTIYVKHNKRLGTKLTVRYKQETVKENKNSVVITESGRTIHKSNIRN